MIVIYCVYFTFSVFDLTIDIFMPQTYVVLQKRNTTLFLIYCLYCVLCHGRVLFLQKLVLTNC
jgi:hypothetical protein